MKPEIKKNPVEVPYIIRNLHQDEQGLLDDFLYEAIYIPEGKQPPAREITKQPELRIYVESFGTRRGDHCLVADWGGKVVGAVWTRIINDYGHVDNETPSFAIAVHDAYRGRGIGSRLMKTMLERLKEKGYKQASLSVQKENYAANMYEKLGFAAIKETDEEYIMVCEL